MGFDRDWFPWLLIGLLILIGVVAFAYWRVGSRIGGGNRVRLAALRGAALILLWIAWFGPSRIRAVTEPIRAQVPILVDRSMSMRIGDGPTGGSRFAAAQEAATQLAERLQDRFDVRLYAFDQQLHPLTAQTQPDGRATAIVEAVRGALDAATGGPVAGAVLLSDGIQTIGTPDVQREWSAPIYPVGLGSPTPPSDVAVVHVQAEPVFYVGETAEARVRVRATGYPGRTFVAVLTREGQPVQTARFTAQSAEVQEEIILRWTPQKEGSYRYEVSIAVLPDEFSSQNNRVRFTAQVLPGRIRVLLVDGMPRYDFGVLRRTFQRLPMVELQAVLLTSPDAPRVPESLPAQLGVYPLDGEVPRLPQGSEWDRWDVVVIGNVAPALWGPAEREALRRFLSRSGRGIIWLAGEAWLSRPLQAEVFEELLPVRLPRGRAPVLEDPFAPIPSAEGRIHPVVQLAGQMEDSLAVWERLPLWERRFVGIQPKPTAGVLLEDARTGEPVLVYQRIDAGKSVFLGTDSLWIWALGAQSSADPAVAASFQRFWGQLLRWVVTPSDAKQVVLQLDRSRVEVGETVGVGIRAYDAGFRPAAEAIVELTAVGPDGERAPIPVYETAPGRFTAQVPIRAVGTHRLEAVARQGPVLLGKDALSFDAEEPRLEFERIAQDTAFLRALAEASGGRVLAWTELDALPDSLQESDQVRVVRVRDALWDHPALFLIVLGLLGAEWFWRKRKGLV